MPGLSFVCDLDRNIDALLPEAQRALDAACHDTAYETTPLVRAPSYFLAASAYPEYPLSAFDFGDVAIHLEGRLYGPAATEALLRTLARGLFEHHDTAQQWVREVDGEFVVFAMQRSTGRLAILNDGLGRLPLYCRRTSRTLLLSREVRFIARVLPRIGFDRMGMAQYLLLGFPLGERTLLDDVARVAPGTCIRIDVRGREISETRTPPLALDPTSGDAYATREAAHDLATRFATGCRARVATHGENVVSLSGGADARSVAACLRNLDIAYRSVTFRDAHGAAAADVAVAERLAALFGSPWHLVHLRPPSHDDHVTLLRRKQGLNPLSMAYLCPYLEQVAQRFGRGIVFFTGDGGDKVLPDLRPRADPDDADGAAAALLRHHQIMPMEHVTALTSVSEVDVILDLRDRLHGYPEQQWVDRCVHFEIFERAFKWLFEGEDRNRGYVWSTAPFYAMPFFVAAMRYGRRHKAYRALYRDFLLALSPAAAAIEYAGVGAPIDSTAFRVAAKAAALLAERAAVQPSVAARHRVPDAATTRVALDGVRQQMARCAALADHVDPDGLAAFLDGPAASLPAASSALFTLTSLIADGGW
jgi:asparagine synthase (glutamine-hydrolysing)